MRRGNSVGGEDGMDGLEAGKKVGLRIESIGGSELEGVRWAGVAGRAWKMELEYVVAFVLVVLLSRITAAGAWFLSRLPPPADAVLFVLRREPPGFVAPLPVLRVRPVAFSLAGPEMRGSGC